MQCKEERIPMMTGVGVSYLSHSRMRANRENTAGSIAQVGL